MLHEMQQAVHAQPQLTQIAASSLVEAGQGCVKGKDITQKLMLHSLCTFLARLPAEAKGTGQTPARR